MSAVLEHPRRHPITVKEYLRMDEAGVFDPEARLELIEGEIIEMAPIGPPHAGTVAILGRLAHQRVGDQAIVWVQGPVVADERSMPQPDLALLAPRTDFYTRAHPAPGDTFLIVEVSDTTLAFDLGRKLKLYARDGFREVWIVDVNARCVRVHRGPRPDGYETALTVTVGGVVSCEALPQLRMDVADLFPA